MTERGERELPRTFHERLLDEQRLLRILKVVADACNDEVLVADARTFVGEHTRLASLYAAACEEREVLLGRLERLSGRVGALLADVPTHPIATAGVAWYRAELAHREIAALRLKPGSSAPWYGQEEQRCYLAREHAWRALLDVLARQSALEATAR